MLTSCSAAERYTRLEEGMGKKKLMTIPELARLLGVSRIAIYKRVKKGEIPAAKVGGMYVISDETVEEVLNRKTSKKGEKEIEAAVHRVVEEYGEVLKLLGKE